MPNAHGRRSFSFQIWFLETNKAGQCNKFKRRPIAVPRFIGRPVRATPNHKMEAASSESLICAAKRQNGGRNSQKALRVPFLINGANFCEEATGHFRSSGEQN